jgi:histidinol-phosphatase
VPTLSEREYRRTLSAVEDALRLSDSLVLRSFRRVRGRLKDDGTEVTAADRGAERVLRRALGAAFPRDAISGEEYGGELTTRGWGWMLDPIDGTASYVLGLPSFGTLVARTLDGEPVFGVIRLPALGETTIACAGRGCWFRRDGERRRRVHVRRVARIAEATIGLSGLHGTELTRTTGRWRFAPLLRSAGRVRHVGDCLQYALLCRGALDAAVDPIMKPWDIAALVPCVREAGGVIGAMGDSGGRLLNADAIVAAGTSPLFHSIRRLVRVRPGSRGSRRLAT